MSTTTSEAEGGKKRFIFNRVDTVEAEDAYMGGRKPKPKRRFMEVDGEATKAANEDFHEIARFRSTNLTGVAMG